MAPPTACNRSAGPAVNPSRSAPGMSSTPSAQSHIRGYRSVGPHSIPSAGVPQVCRGACGGTPRAQRNRGYPRRPPGSPGRGLCLDSARPPRHIMPRAQSHLTSSAAVAALAFAAGMPRASISSRRRRQPLGPLPPVHPYLEGHARVPRHELRLVPCRGVAP